MRISQRYEDEIKFDIVEISKEKNIELLKDFSDNLCKSLTEVEQKIIDILYGSKEAITINKMRNIFTEAYLINICQFVLESKEKLKSSTNIPESHVKSILKHAEDYAEDRKKSISITYPKEMVISLKTAIEIIEECLVGIRERKSKEKIKDVDEVTDIDILRAKETETKFVDRIRRVLSSKGHRVPSIDAIKPSLEYLKEKNIAKMRMQNNNQLWYLTPEFNTINRRLEKQYNRTIQETE